ncbi:hypothetical protein RYX36_037157 [Vicia faba]
MVNKGSYTVWPEIVSGAGTAPFSTIGFVPQPVKSNALARLPSWSGRLWGTNPQPKRRRSYVERHKTVANPNGRKRVRVGRVDSCPNLEVLSIRSCPRVTDDSISKIATGCPNLKELDISYYYEITHESLVLIGRNCSNLKVLKRNLMNWLDPSQHIGIVPDDYLNVCPQDGGSEAAAIAIYMPHLESLKIRFSKLTAKGLNLICQGVLIWSTWICLAALT